MQLTNFDEAFELIRARDRRYPREAYLFVQEALDHTQKAAVRNSRARVRHVTGRELLEGIREYALAQFGPMAVAVFEEWQIHSCQDFGEIVFNLVEAPVSARFTKTDLKDPKSFLSRLEKQSGALSQFLWSQLAPERVAVLKDSPDEALGNLLAEELTRVCAQGPIYEAKRFAGVRLSDHASALLEHSFSGVQLARVNRLLLQEAFPTEIVGGPGLLAKTDKDSRADFVGGYDFWDAFRKPFLPTKAQNVRRREANVTRV